MWWPWWWRWRYDRLRRTILAPGTPGWAYRPQVLRQNGNLGTAQLKRVWVRCSINRGPLFLGPWFLWETALPFFLCFFLRFSLVSLAYSLWSSYFGLPHVLFCLFFSFRVCSGMLVSPRWEIGNSLHATVAFAGFRKWLSHAALKLEKGYSLLYTGIYF